MRSQATRLAGLLIGLTLLVIVVQNIVVPIAMVVWNVFVSGGPLGLGYPTPPRSSSLGEVVVFFGVLLVIGMPIAWLLGRYRYKWTKH